MINPRSKLFRYPLRHVYCATLFIACPLYAQFVAFNDHAPGAATAPNVTTWNIDGAAPGSTGALVDLDSGTTLSVQLRIATFGAIFQGSVAGNPDLNTPLYNVFNGYVDFQGSGDADAVVQVPSGSTVTYNFTGLDPAKVYSFKGGVVRGNASYLNRWSLIEIDGARSFVSAHAGGLTNGLISNQIAINTGYNTKGDMVDWENIVPSATGTFSVVTTQYTNSIPGGGNAISVYGYALNAVRLEEFDPTKMSPIAVTGFNADVVIEKGASGPPYNSAAVELNPNEGNAFYQKRLPGTSYGLPLSGVFQSDLDGGTIFQFHPYTASNALVLSGDTGVSSGALTLVTPAVYEQIALIANSASGGSVCSMTLNFADGSSLDASYNALDWFNNAGEALEGTERISLSSGSTQGAPDNPRFYQTTIDLASLLGPTNKPLLSILFYKSTAAPSTGIYALSGLAATYSSALILVQPSNVVVAEGLPATFAGAVSGNPAPQFQWFRDGTPISGASAQAFTLPTVSVADDNARFFFVASNVVSNLTHSVTSAVATLSVIPDTNPPVLLRAQSLGLNEVEVSFSKRVSSATGNTASNYAILGTGGSVAVSSASLDGSQSNVVLSVAPMSDGAAYTVFVDKINDQSGNVIAPDSQSSFRASIFLPTGLGLPLSAGLESGATNGLDLTAGGVGIGGTNDQAQFGYIVKNGNFDVCARLGSLAAGNAWAEAGLMAREDLSPGGRFAAVLATPSISGAFLSDRSATNGSAVSAGSFPVNYPNTWLRLQRVGNVFTAYAGLDGQNWSSLGSASLNFPASVYFGFVASSHDTNALAAASLRELSDVVTPGTNVTLTAERPGQSARRTSIVISEIMYHPTNSSLEFIELFNTRGEPQSIGGWRLAGSVNYTFPANTVIAGGGLLVVAKSPANLQTNYGLGNVLGPFSGSLPNSSGTVELLNQSGALFLEIDYSDSPPWPVAADGFGHSLVLSHPSYGENDPRAWSASDTLGGSPGRLDSFTPDPLRDVVINEFLAHPVALEPFLELYNTASSTLDLSGCVLGCGSQTSSFVIPPGTTIGPGAFLSRTFDQLGFRPDPSGDTLFLRDSSRVLDIVRYTAQQSDLSFGRAPDGSSHFRPLAAPTAGVTNSPAFYAPIVINEIMYAPISLDDNDQYVELYNRGSNSVDLGGWRFSAGIDYAFPVHTILPAGGYLVVARDTARMLARYSYLSSGLLLGNFGGSLAHTGEHLALSSADPLIVTNQGVISTNIIYPVENELTYGDGGRWGQWSHKGGSSLELIDPHSDNTLAPNWADSDETHKAPWTVISATGVLDNSTYGSSADELQVLVQGAGECLVDDVQVLDSQNVNHISNSSFENGASGWTAEGTESLSTLQTTEGYNSAQSYHIRAIEKGDNEVNRVRTPVSPTLPANSTATIQAKVRWLTGQPEVLVRFRGNFLECVGEMTLPQNLGTPGLPNSRMVSNAPPAITGVMHSPVLPPASQPVTVTASINDPDGVASAVVKYRIDPGSTYASVPMTRNSRGGYTAAIPGQSSGATIAYYVSATDAAARPATGSFPNDAPKRECLVRVGEVQPTGNFPVYRIWMTQTTYNTWLSRNHMDNSPFDVTFVLDDDRVIYNTQALYAGSPYIAPGYSGPASGACGYSVSFPDDDLFLGSGEMVLDWAGGHGGETTALQEEMGYWIADQLNLPFSHRYIIRLNVNGVTDTARRVTFEAVMQPSGDFIDEWSPARTGGDFFKIERAFEFSDAGSLVADPEPDIEEYTTTGGVKKTARYRWNWLFRASDRVNNFSNLYQVVDAFNSPQPEPYQTNIANLVDIEEWMRLFATEHIIVNFDAWGHDIGKNMYLYLPPGGKAQIYMFDLDWLMLAAPILGSQYAPSVATLFNSEDPVIAKAYTVPPFARAYWRAVQDAVNGPLAAANCNPVIEAKSQSLFANGIQWCDGQPLTPPGAVENWFSQRLAYLKSQLATVASPFTISNKVAVTNNAETLSGTAPIAVATILFDGVPIPLVWTTVSNWSATISLRPGTNLVSVVGVDLRNVPVLGASNSIVTIDNSLTDTALQFTPGNLAVLRVGDGAQTLGSHGNSVFLDQFTTNGALVNSLAVPDSGSNALVISGSAASEGALSRSADGRFLMFGGYQISLSSAAALGSSLSSADAAAVPRALGAVDAAGGFALVGVTDTQYGGNNMRGGASDGLGNYWGAGASSGTIYLGDGPADAVQTTVKNTETIQDVGGDLFFTTAKTTAGLWEIPGTPTEPATPQNLLASPTGSPYGFVFSPDRRTVYIADDTAASLGGIQRWDFTNAVWQLSYAFAGLTNAGARGIVGDFSGAHTVLYATSAESSANHLVSLIDTGANAAVTTLAIAGPNQLFRGVVFTPPATDFAPKIFRAARGVTNFTLSWTALIGRSYTVQYADTLEPASWQSLATFIASSPTAAFTDSAVPADIDRFYRILLNP